MTPGRSSAVLAALMLSMAACAANAPQASLSPAPADATPTADVTAAAATDSPIVSDIIGYWHRAQTCEELLATFTEAGLAESHRGWLQGNFYGGQEGPATGDPCAGRKDPWSTRTGSRPMAGLALTIRTEMR
jgi:hypothetical protein